MANRIKVAIASSILTLRQQGWSFRRIAEALGVHRETVARHVRLAEAGAKPATNLSTGSEADGEPKPANLSAPSASLRTDPNKERRRMWCRRQKSASFCSSTWMLRWLMRDTPRVPALLSTCPIVGRRTQEVKTNAAAIADSSGRAAFLRFESCASG